MQNKKDMPERRVLGLCFVFSAVFFTSPLFASPMRPQGVQGFGKLRVQQNGAHVFKTDVQSQDGRFAISNAGLRLSNAYTFENRLSLDASLSVDHYVLRDSTAVGLPSSLQSKGFSVGTKIPMPFLQNGRLFLGLDAGPYFQTAREHDFSSDALRMKSRVYGIYRDREDFVFVAGVMVYSGYEDKTAMPFAGVRYVINERWTIHALSQEPFVEYQLTEKTAVKWLFGGFRDEFEVASGARKGDVVKINEFHAGMGLEHAFTTDARLQVSAGWSFNRKYEYMKTGGKVVPEDGVFIGWMMRAAF